MKRTYRKVTDNKYIYYHNNCTTDTLDLQLKYNYEEIGFYTIFKATYFKFKGLIPVEKLLQYSQIFEKQIEYINFVTENFGQKNGYFFDENFEQEINKILSISNKNRDNNKRREARENQYSNHATNVATFVATNDATNGATKAKAKEKEKEKEREKEKIKNKKENSLRENFFTDSIYADLAEAYDPHDGTPWLIRPCIFKDDVKNAVDEFVVHFCGDRYTDTKEREKAVSELLAQSQAYKKYQDLKGWEKVKNFREFMVGDYGDGGKRSYMDWKKKLAELEEFNNKPKCNSYERSIGQLLRDRELARLRQMDNDGTVEFFGGTEEVEPEDQ